MTTLSLDRTHEASDLTLDLSLDLGLDLDLSVVTIESMVARDISAYSERRRRAGDRPGERATR